VELECRLHVSQTWTIFQDSLTFFSGYRITGTKCQLVRRSIGLLQKKALLLNMNSQNNKPNVQQQFRKEDSVMKTLVKTNGTLFPAIPSLVEDFLMRDLMDGVSGNWRSSGATLPAVNVRETNDAFNIEVAAPGMKRDDFHVELDNHVLTISSEQENNQKHEDGKYSRREFSYQAFQRSFALPENKIDGEKISAKYADGILYLSVPKKEEAKVKPPKQISVG
jgi:HSP20 family protein